ncbi:hypothetical protein SH139x_005708 [Planctomycetaceae bacterium SH139]
MARTIPDLGSGLLADLDRNFLHAVYTPFSFILFYEVLLLVLALPQSHTSSIGKQYEIVSLIVIRRVFKDIGEFRDPATWLSQLDEALMVLMDMGAAVLMFVLVTAFHRIRQTVIHSNPQDDLNQFVSLKKSVAVLLCGTLLLLAAYSLLHWFGDVLTLKADEIVQRTELDLFFFPAFFEFMIFTDVFLLIISLPFYERYEYVIRNAGFVISTVLLRFSLSTPKPYDLAVGLIAMVYGLCVLAVFSYFTRISAAGDREEAEVLSANHSHTPAKID